jgi:hypothetical protein
MFHRDFEILLILSVYGRVIDKIIDCPNHTDKERCVISRRCMEKKY